MARSCIRSVDRLSSVDPHPEAAPLHRQIEYLRHALERNVVLIDLLEVAASMGLADWYLGAGGVAQTIWNFRHGYDLTEGIKDYDIVYFDGSDLTATGESAVGAELARRAGPGVAVDVKNEARVHTWYGQRFGQDIEPYTSTEAAIATWPSTASCVGVRIGQDGFEVCAPYGLADLLGLVVRPNKTLVTREVYEEKARRWAGQWPQLKVHSW